MKRTPNDGVHKCKERECDEGDEGGILWDHRMSVSVGSRIPGKERESKTYISSADAGVKIGAMMVDSFNAIAALGKVAFHQRVDLEAALTSGKKAYDSAMA